MLWSIVINWLRGLHCLYIYIYIRLMNEGLLVCGDGEIMDL